MRRERRDAVSTLTAGPLQRRADELHRRLTSKRSTRGDVEAIIQAAVMEALRAMAGETCSLCERGAHRSDPLFGTSDDDDYCYAAGLWQNFLRVRSGLWGRLA